MTKKFLLPVGLALTVLVAIYVAGALAIPVTESRAQVPSEGWPAPPTVPSGRIAVALVVGAGGNEITDVMGPYEVFSHSERFFVYTVSSSRTPVRLFGGPELLPDFTTADVDRGVAPRPDLVVVPRLEDPSTTLGGWVVRQSEAGARVLGVCNGAYVLAEAGLLDGRRATAYWPSLPDLDQRYPDVTWVRGQRYVQDGSVTTTAGITSGIVGSLRLVEQLAGQAEAERIGRSVGYPGWSVGASTDIPAQRRDAADYPSAIYDWVAWRPTVGVALADGMGEIDIASVIDVFFTSDAAVVLPVSAGPTVRTRHGMLLYVTPAGEDTPGMNRLLVPGVQSGEGLSRWAAGRDIDSELVHADRVDGEPSFDAALRSLARFADSATARTTAKYLEYPADAPSLPGVNFPIRPIMTLMLTLVVAVGIAALPMLIRLSLRRRR